MTQREEAKAIVCCMCGDFGVSSELFRCKLCRFRSQHRYCSNLYPKVEAYELCNWCLSSTSQKEDPTKSQNSSSSSKSDLDCKKKKINGSIDGLNAIKKQGSLDKSSLAVARKRIITCGALEEKLRRTKSEDISNINRNRNSNSNNSRMMIKKHIIKNRVRRYKFLDEVSS
ncbi:hypothetical protein ACFE04_015512 [Oxalis oulophora]